MTPKEAKTLLLDELVERSGQPGSVANAIIELEMMRRQTIAAQSASEATVRAAKHAERNADYMLWSVIVLAASSFAAFALAMLTYFKPA